MIECVAVAQRCHGECSELTLGEKKKKTFIFLTKSAIGHLNRLLREVVDALCLSMIKWRSDNALNDIL